MKHPFPLKEIALQSGLSLATVDRALHGRAHVSAQTARRVQAAIVELTRQEGQLAARGRRMFIDIVVEAPRRFSDELRRAANQVSAEICARGHSATISLCRRYRTGQNRGNSC